MGTQNGHIVFFLESESLKKRKRKAPKRIKQIDKISKKGNKVEGSRKYRRMERVPKAGSRREETITEPFNSCIGEFPHNNCGQMMPAVWNVAEPFEV